MTEFWLLHDYGAVEGIKVHGKYPTILEAVLAREGTLHYAVPTHIVEWIDPIDAYLRASYERERQKKAEKL